LNVASRINASVYIVVGGGEINRTARDNENQKKALEVNNLLSRFWTNVWALISKPVPIKCFASFGS
jgi:hypothetical protein